MSSYADKSSMAPYAYFGVMSAYGDTRFTRRPI
jgi:hypothetical protein